MKAAFIGLTLIVGLPALGLALAYALGARPATTVAAASPAVPAAKTEARSKPAEVAPTAEDMINLLYPECRNTPIAKMTRGQIEDCENEERYTRGMHKLIDEAHERNDHDAAAWQRAKDREAENLKKGRGPGSFEVCGPDRWQKDHWEPSCR